MKSLEGWEKKGFYRFDMISSLWRRCAPAAAVCSYFSQLGNIWKIVQSYSIAIMFLNSIMFQMVFVVAWINEHLPNEKTSKRIPDFDTDCTFSAWRSNAEFRWQGLSWPKSLMVLENGERERTRWILMRDLWCDVTRGDNGVKMASFYNPVAKLYGEF